MQGKFLISLAFIRTFHDEGRHNASSIGAQGVTFMQAANPLESYFRDEVDRALRDQGMDSGPLTEHYLVALLGAYAVQPIDEEPLALKLLAAMDAAPRQRRAQLREVGDTSLYVSGFWAESFANRVVDQDYYIGVGGSAYRELARGGPGWTADPFGDVFGELSSNFSRFVDVLTAVSRRTIRLGSNQDVVRLYERWTRTRSRWAARRLAALGVVPGKGDERPQ